VHNVYPHDISETNKLSYIDRFRSVSIYFDLLIVHNDSSKILLSSDFNINASKIEVVYHGIFETKTHLQKKSNSNCFNILMFGVQSMYKGTDILIKALAELPIDVLNKVSVTIAGKTDKSLYSEYKDKADKLKIHWINRFIEDEELNQMIIDSDLLIFPYREISQSGALLLALNFSKPIVTSDLPSFIETLEGYPQNLFFKSGDINSLSILLNSCILGNMTFVEAIKVIDCLKEKYSWKNSAERTIIVYNKLI
jgi:glycosyltransferase involved in cell wall biosynthesis